MIIFLARSKPNLFLNSDASYGFFLFFATVSTHVWGENTWNSEMWFIRCIAIFSSDFIRNETISITIHSQNVLVVELFMCNVNIVEYIHKSANETTENTQSYLYILTKCSRVRANNSDNSAISFSINIYIVCMHCDTRCVFARIWTHLKIVRSMRIYIYLRAEKEIRRIEHTHEHQRTRKWEWSLEYQENGIRQKDDPHTEQRSFIKGIWLSEYGGKHWQFVFLLSESQIGCCFAFILIALAVLSQHKRNQPCGYE